MKNAAFVFAAIVVAASNVFSAQADEKQTPGSGINVQTCSAEKGRPAYTQTYTDSEGKVRTRHVDAEDSFLTIHYRNTSAAAAREVDFGLVARNELVEKVKDVGTFSPEILIEHKFKVSRDIFPLRTALLYCAVLRVRYHNGHVWSNPNPPKD
ncbi:MAG TPA: hypothetical protein VKT72_13815 [Candidatus Baltobacteraceae bacterium]|nr:hypothetical protein [Candidatus Baltobacteraceae bacterium]